MSKKRKTSSLSQRGRKGGERRRMGSVLQSKSGEKKKKAWGKSVCVCVYCYYAIRKEKWKNICKTTNKLKGWVSKHRERESKRERVTCRQIQRRTHKKANGPRGNTS